MVLLKILDGMVEKLTEDLPRSAVSPTSGSLTEKRVITYQCCSFLVLELSRLYNKDFKYNADIYYNQNQANNNDNINNNNNSNDNNSNTSSPAFGSVTTLSDSDYEIVYFILRILGHITSCVEECDSSRVVVGGDDLRTKLGKEGLLAIVLGTLFGAPSTLKIVTKEVFPCV